jgi:hypothetical protein
MTSPRRKKMRTAAINLILGDYEMEETVVPSAAQVTLDEDNDEDKLEDDDDAPKWGGSRPGRLPNINRDFSGAYRTLIKHYFSGPDSLYNEQQFEDRFRMPRSVFQKIWQRINGKGLFVHRQDATKKRGIHPLCRLVACLRVLAYGTSADMQDEYLQMSKSATAESIHDFCRVMLEEFGNEYFNRCPREEERDRSMKKMEHRGFKGAFASWDCKHFVWKNCPVRWAGNYQGHCGGKRTFILEAIADADLYFWYVFFGEPGSLNDLNVLGKSSIVGAILNGTFNISVPDYKLDETTIDWLYFLADGIYPNWAIFVKTYVNATDPDKVAFAKVQEAARKDIERAFGVLVAKFHILKHEINMWYTHNIQDLVHVCIILHNMVVKERIQVESMFDNDGESDNDEENADTWHNEEEVNADIDNEDTHFRLFDSTTVNDHEDDHSHLLLNRLSERVQLVDEGIRSVTKYNILRMAITSHVAKLKK